MKGTMKISKLLAQRQGLLQQTQLANLAFAYAKLGEFAGRVARAQLTGEVNLRQGTPEVGIGWATLTAHEGSQSVVEEHFTEEEINDWADIVGFFSVEEEVDLTFRLEELTERFVVPLRRELEGRGVVFDGPADTLESPDGPGARGCRPQEEWP
jgi:hypothetical protein